MKAIVEFLKYIVTSLAILAGFGAFTLAGGLAASGEEGAGRLDALFAKLAEAGPEEAVQIENDIWSQWSRSGDPAMDLLLQRGRAAMEAGDAALALEHFTALTDHAPGFAEGWNARATAFFQLGQYGLSIDDITRALALEPRHFGALTGLGHMLAEMGYDKEALEAYREVLAIHPHATGVAEVIGPLEKALEGRAL